MLGLSSDIVFALKGVAPPALLASLLLLVAWRPWQRPKVEGGGGWATGFALALGLTAAFAGLRGWSFLAPVSGQDWLPWAGVAAAIVGLVAKGRAAAVLRVLLMLGIAWATLAVLWARRWDHGAAGLLHVGGSALLLWLLAAGLSPLAARRSGPVLPIAWCMVASVAGFVLFSATHSSFLGQLSGSMAAVFGVAISVAVWNSKLSLGREGGLVFAVLLGTLALNGGYSMYTDPDGIPLLPLALLAVAALAPWVEEVLAGRPTLVRAALTLSAVAVPLGLAVWAAWPEPSPYGY